MIHVIKLEILVDTDDPKTILNEVLDATVDAIDVPITGIVAYIGEDEENDDDDQA